MRLGDVVESFGQQFDRLPLGVVLGADYPGRSTRLIDDRVLRDCEPALDSGDVVGKCHVPDSTTQTEVHG